jgi:hypothetical protein
MNRFLDDEAQAAPEQHAQDERPYWCTVQNTASTTSLGGARSPESLVGKGRQQALLEATVLSVRKGDLGDRATEAKSPQIRHWA